MSLPRFVVSRPVTSWMFLIGLCLLGGAALVSFSVDLFPNIDFPVAFVQSPYPGVDPKQMENVVTRKIEEEVNTVANVKKIMSMSFEGFSWITVEFNWGTNVDLAAVDLREKVDIAKRNLPRDMEQITVAKFDINSQPIMELSLGGDFDLKSLRTIADREIKPAFERIPGIANVEIFGGLEREIRVKVSPEKLTALQITVNDVLQAIGSDNQNTPVGNVTEGRFKYLVRSEGEFKKPEDLGKIIIKQFGQRPVYLSDVAVVSDAFKEIESVSRLNGKPAVNLSLKKESGANPVQISDRVKKLIPQLESRYRGRLSIAIAQDGSDFIRDSINMVKENTLYGALLSVIVIFIFLWNVRSTLILGLTIPMAVIMTFAFLYLKKGITLNLMTLGGLALGIGMIVDNAIVVLENIYRRLRTEGNSTRMECSVTGTEQTTLAIQASTLTHCAVFIPIGFVPGIVGEIFFNMSLSIVFSLVASYITAIMVVPLLSSRFLKTHTERGEPILDFIKKVYSIFLRFLLKSTWRQLAYFGFMTALFLGSFQILPPFEFFPKMDRGQFIIKFEMPEGTSLDTSDGVTGQIEAILKRYPDVEKIQANSKMAEGTISVSLVEIKRRKFKVAQLIARLREEITRIPGYRNLVFSEPSMGPPDSGKPIQIEVTGDDFAGIASICLDIAQRIKGVPGLKDIDNGVREGRPEVKVEFDREKIRDLGISLGEIAGMFRTFIYGTVAGKYREGNDEYDIRVEAADRYKDSVDKLLRLELPLDEKTNVQVSQVGKFSDGRGYSKIERKNLKRLFKVQADIEGRPLQAVVLDISAILKDLQLPPGYNFSFGGEEEERQEAFGYLGLALIASIVLVYMIMASLFESLYQSFIIMFTIPLSFIGVVLSLNLYGFAFSITAMIGLIMLAGIVVNNGIILVDFANQARSEGQDKATAALNAATIRLRPVLMTALTTIIGMFPLSLGIGAGSDFYQPLAITVIGGLTVSTVLTLTYIPVMYVLVDNVVEWFQKIFSRIF